MKARIHIFSNNLLNKRKFHSSITFRNSNFQKQIYSFSSNTNSLLLSRNFFNYFGSSVKLLDQIRTYSSQKLLKDIKILGIETSCDDTGIAIVNGEVATL